MTEPENQHLKLILNRQHYRAIRLICLVSALFITASAMILLMYLES